MDLVKLRKTEILIEEIHHEFGPPPGRLRLRGAIAAVIHNPYAGRYVADITPMMEALKPLGLAMARRLVEAMGGDAKSIEAYGKAAIIGGAGEVEHGALWHVPGGYGMREILGGANAPRPDELVFILAMTNGARIHDRVGGLRASEIKGEDGQR